MITCKPLDHGYGFFMDDKEIAVGEYENGVFTLIESEDISFYDNAVVALHHLRRKHIPAFYNRTLIKPVVEDTSKTTISRYKGHVALQTIDKEAFHAWELKNGSRRNKS